jgi:hypothetical protein
MGIGYALYKRADHRRVEEARGWRENVSPRSYPSQSTAIVQIAPGSLASKIVRQLRHCTVPGKRTFRDIVRVGH